MIELIDKYEAVLQNTFKSYYHPSQKAIVPLSILFYIPLLYTGNILGVIALSGLVCLHVHIVYRENKKWENNKRTINPEEKEVNSLLGQAKDVTMKEQLTADNNGSGDTNE